MRNEKELSANLPSAKVVGIECRVVEGLGHKERVCVVVEYEKFANVYGLHTPPGVSFQSVGITKASIPIDFFKTEPKGKKKKGWLMQACRTIWSFLGGGNLTLSEIKGGWGKAPSSILVQETERLIEQMRQAQKDSGAKALEDSMRRQARKFVEECENLKLDPLLLMQEESDLYHVERVMDA